MTRRNQLLLLTAPTLAIVVAAAVWFFTSGHSPSGPYAGLDQREIKALAPETVEGLRRGEGLGYALSAELNDVPGPKHALELDLGLTDEQRVAIEAVRAAMAEEARLHGEALIDAERALDDAFAAGTPTPDDVERLTATAAIIEGRVRAAHLKAHLATQPILTPEQREAYAAARGYGHTGHAGH